jgi:hypothetical protein
MYSNVSSSKNSKELVLLNLIGVNQLSHQDDGIYKILAVTVGIKIS